MNGWSFELLDSEDRPLDTLDGVTGGSAEIVAQSPLGGSGALELDDRQDMSIDWMRHRIRAIFSDGETSWPVGTFLLTSPVENHTEVGLTYSVGLLTKMNVPHEDTVEDRYTLPVGAAIIPTVVALLESTGETRIAVTASAATLTSGLTWEAGTSKLTIINDLLQAAGYWSLWCDGSGLFRVEPYVDPASRPVAFEFEHGERSLHFPDWNREQDHTSVPNRFVAVGQGDEEAPPLVGVATNEDPESPYSYQSRGRWITATEEGVEATSQAVIDQHAARRLMDAMTPVSRLAVTHAMLPLDPNDLVAFTPEDGRRRLATVQRMTCSFKFDTDMQAEWREVFVAAPAERPATEPAAPTLSVATTTTKATATWSVPFSGGSPLRSFEVQRSLDADFRAPVEQSTTEKSWTFDQLTPGLDQWFRVRATNAVGEGPWSDPVYAATRPGFPLGLTGAAGTLLNVPTHVSPAGGQTTHPSVVDAGAPWNGYRYWMAHTPYPAGNDEHEDPNIVASKDGTTWVVPTGLTNPIDDVGGTTYNSDVDLVLHRGVLWLIWRTYDPGWPAGTEERMYLSKSTNGVDWSPKVLVHQTSDEIERLMSPSLVFEDGAWSMYAIDILPSPNRLVRKRSSGPNLTAPSDWGAAAICAIAPAMPSGREPWHVQVRVIDDTYVALLNDCALNTSGNTGDLYLARSFDGVAFTRASSVAVPRAGGTGVGHAALYRASLVRKTESSLDVWYAGWLTSPSIVWNVFRTTLT